MIFTDRTIIVQKGTSSINDTIILYRGDRDIEVRFTLNEGSPFKFGSGANPNIIEKAEAAYGQLVIKTPNDLPSIFSEVAPTNEGKIVLKITGEMIDEITEVGNYAFQIRLLDEGMNARVTLPEVNDGIEIREPIATEDVSSTNEVGEATVGYALTTAGVSEDAFDSQGNYNKTTWGTGDRITAAKLNKMEAGIDGVNKKVANDQDRLTTAISVNGITYTHSNGTITLPDYPTVVSTASGISIVDTANNFTATNVEDALMEVSLQMNNINSNYKKKIFNWKQGTYKDNSNTIESTNYKAYTDMTKVLLGSKITIKITDTTKYKYRLFIFNKDKEFVRQTVDYTDETSLIMNYPYFALVIKQQDGQTFEPSPIINDYIYCEIENYSDDVYYETKDIFYTGNAGGTTANANYNSVYFLAEQGREYQLYPSVRKLCIVENGEYVFYDEEKQNYSFIAEEDFICRLSYQKINDGTQQKNNFQIASYNSRHKISYEIDDKFYSYNLFDKSKSVAGYLGNGAGEVWSNARYKTSDFIYVFSGASYIISTSIFEILFYDASKTPIASSYAKMDVCGYTFNVPVGANYVRFSYLNVFEDYVQLIKTDTKKLLPYQPYDSFGNLSLIYKNENKLSGKTLLTLGDSIMEGNGNANVGMGEILCCMNQMQHIELSKGGATIGFRSDYSGDDKTHLQKQQNIQYQVDYAIANYADVDCILINGSTNDIDKKNILGLGDMLQGYDTTSAVLNTFSGGLESIFYKLKTTYPKARIIYIRPHNIGSRPYQLQVDYGERAKDICKKWSVYCVDLFEDSGLNTNLEPMIPFTNNNDQCHPNHEGYINYYIPLIENALKSLF